MTTDVLLPGLGESITEGTIVRWLKEPGDRVERDEALVEVETDKLTTEVPSPAAGTLLAIRVPVGQTADVGTVLGVLGEAGDVVAAAPAPASKSVPSSSAVTAPASPVPTPIAPIASAQERNEQARASGDNKLFVSPVVRRLAREHDVDLGQVAGTGAGGRVTRRDLEAFVAGGGAGSGFTAPPGGYTPGLKMPAGGFGGRLPFDRATPARFAAEVWEGDRVEPLSGLGRAMAEHMAWTWWRAPHVSTIVEVDVGRIAEHRRATRDAGGPSLSTTACVAWALARTLRDHPGFNSSLTDDHRRVVHRGVHLGVAVARPDGGLLVPVVRGADGLSLQAFNAAYGDLVERARQGAITPSDLRGGTFTLTNVGSNGNLASMPLINQPQVGILAIGAIQKRVVVITDADGRDAIAIRPMMYVTLTYDHRANDGAASGRMLKDLRQRLESWDPQG
jgi:pyruvate/2-oxoglutarate dehydrogenase complex dihydrolipoamide acyltransferase (E2) component